MWSGAFPGSLKITSVFKESVKKFSFLVAAALLFALPLKAQEDGALYYYGVVTNVQDQNMLKITQDLFAAQLRGIDGLSLVDKRADPVKDSYSAVETDADGSTFFASIPEDSSATGGIAFFARIYRPRSDEKWECTFFAKNYSSKKTASRGKQYDSYYKILTDAKFLIQSVVAECQGAEVLDEAASPGPQSVKAESSAHNVENIAGTWNGEPSISKIIIMRSGRGFIVFTNGATMNISISFGTSGEGEETLRIVQQDKFNASYYPNIDRKTILDFAQSAAPIEWNLTLTSGGNLEGIKKTLGPGSGGVQPVSERVVWQKK